jgi:tetratricopeptide (TPR) repeat protein
MAIEPGHDAIEPKPAALVGECVAFTGRFASLNRAQARRLVSRASGRFAEAFSSRVTLLVVGAAGWPLLSSGRVPRALEAAERLLAKNQGPRIISEDRFRELLGLATPPDLAAQPKTLDLDHVARVVGVEPAVIRRWELLGLVRAEHGRFDFRDLVSLRAITALVARGISPVVIRTSLESLARLLPAAIDHPLSQLSLLVSDSGSLAAELEEAFLTPSGQLELRFAPRRSSSDDAPRPLRPTLHRAEAPSADPAEQAIAAGLVCEAAGEIARAREAYARAAGLRPRDPTPVFNLGNLLLREGRPAQAAEYFRRAANLDPSHAKAWFNLAHAQEQSGQPREALESLRRAARADPHFADAHFNLADLAQRQHEDELAARAWRAFLRLDSSSPWAAEARRRLALLRGRAWA